MGANQTTLSNSIQPAPKPLSSQPPFVPPAVAAETTAGRAGGANQNFGSSPTPVNGPEIGWRFSGSVSDPSQAREFTNPTANMNDWLQAMHYESTAVPPTVPAEAVASQPLPKQMDSPSMVEQASAVQVANHVQASPSSHPAQPVVQAVLPAAEPIDPQLLQSPLQRAVAALAKGDTEAAIEAATRGLARTPDQAAPLYRVLGAAHYRRGEYQVAQTALAQALSLDKSDALAYFLMGSTLAKQNEHEAAAKYLAEAARLDVRFAN
jgi:predicted Zn-dependent protease